MTDLPTPKPVEPPGGFVPPKVDTGVTQPVSDKPKPLGFLNRQKAEPKPPRTRTPKAAPPYRSGMFVKPLEEMYTTIGMMLMVKDPVCATAIIESAHDCAKSLDDLAAKNDTVRRVLASIVETSVVGQILVAHLPIIMAIVSHHTPMGKKAANEGINMAELFANQNGKSEEK